jgi:hypothetical protein
VLASQPTPVLAFEAELAHFPRSLISALWEAAPPEIDHQLVSELLGEVTHWWQRAIPTVARLGALRLQP